MADFSKFKIGNTSYNVKDVNAGKSLSLSGKDLSLKNAAGKAVSTVTLPDDTIYLVEVRYTDNTVTGQASDAVTPMKAGNGSWSTTVTPALPAGKTLNDVNRVFAGYCSFPKADPGYTDHMLYNTSTNMNYVTFGVEDDNLTHHIGALVTLFIYADGSVMKWGWTDLGSGGSSSSAITSANIHCANASLWDVASTQQVTIDVDEVIIDGQVGRQLTLAELIQVIVDKFNTAPGTDLKISITGQGWSVEVLSYSINSGTVTIYFEVFAGSQMFKRYATFSSSSPTSLSLTQAQ